MKLTTSGMRSPEVRRMLRSARTLIENSEFWRYQSDGLAVFISPDRTEHYRLPMNFQESITVGDRWLPGSINSQSPGATFVVRHWPRYSW